jgi:hypothetical protein
VQNAGGLLDDKGPHVLTQAEWAIPVARAAILRVLRGPSEDARLGTMIQQVFRLAQSRAGRQLMREHGIETLRAVPIDELRAEAPQHQRQLLAVERAIASRGQRARQH